MTDLEFLSQERRLFERFPLDLELHYIRPGSRQEQYAQSRDISAGGISLITSQPLDPGLLLWLSTPYEKGKVILTKGYVAWSHVVSPDRHRSGIQFVNANLSILSKLLKRKPQE